LHAGPDCYDTYGGTSAQPSDDASVNGKASYAGVSLWGRHAGAMGVGSRVEPEAEKVTSIIFPPIRPIS
jgi:hypothetical protein